jgi:hypothetical protein
MLYDCNVELIPLRKEIQKLAKSLYDLNKAVETAKG